MIIETFQDEYGEEAVIIYLRSREIVIVRGGGRVEAYSNMQEYLASKPAVLSIVVPE